MNEEKQLMVSVSMNIEEVILILKRER